MKLLRLSCGDRMALVEIGETPPTLAPWTTYPLDIGNTIEPGDSMTCITCDEVKEVTEVL